MADVDASVLDALKNVPASAGPSVWTDMPPAPVRDTAPSVPQLRFKTNEGVSTSSLDPVLVERANRLYDMMPAELREQARITSARRTTEQQAAAYQRYQTGQGGLAARPGHSQHESGAAFDFQSGPALTWLTENAPKVGLAFPFGSRGDPGHMQLAEVGAKSEGVRDAKRASQGTLSHDEFQQLLDGVPVAGSGESATPASRGTSLTEALDTGTSAVTPEGLPVGDTAMAYSEQTGAILNGIRKGLMSVPLGAAQAVLPKEVMAPVEEKVRQLDSQFSELEEKHPTFDTVGKLTGATVGILLGARALGAVAPAMLPAVTSRALTAAWTAIGPVARTAAVGAAVGGTEFYREGEEREQRPFGIPARAFDTAMGGLFGTVAGVAARGVQWAARNLADTTWGGQFLGVLQQTASGMTRNSEVPLTEALSFYRAQESLSSSRYNLRNAAGRQFEGFPSGVGASEVGAPEGFAQAINDALAETRKAGVETRRAVEGAASRVRSLLGLDKEEGRLAEWKATQAQYEKRVAEVAAAERGHPLAGGFERNPQLLEQLRATGVLPAQPLPPPPYQPRPVPADAYAQARTAINSARRRTRDPAARYQLDAMQRGLDSVAADTAAEYGVVGDTFLRRAIAANKFYEQNVAPLRQFFGGRTAAEVAGRTGVPLDGMTPAAFYDRVAKIIDSDDVRQVQGLAGMFGARGRENMRMIAATEALAGVEKGGASSAYAYVKDHENVLRELLGREEFTQLAGMGKVADTLARQYKESPRRKIFDWSHSLGPAFAFYALFEGHFARAAEITLALPAYHFAVNAIQSVHLNPLMRPLIKRAATLRPRSAELDELVGSIERRMRATTVPAARAISSEQSR